MMRKLLLLCFLSCTLTLCAQQSKSKTTPKAKTTATTQKKTPAAPQQAGKKTSAKTTTTKSNTGKSSTAKKKTTTQKSSSSAKTTVPTTKDIQKLQKEQATLQKQIKESESLLQSTKKDVKSQLANLALISGRITNQQAYVKGIQSEVDTLTHSIGVLSKDLMLLEEDLAECKRKYSHGVMYMYRTRLSQNKLMFIFSAKDFRQMYRRLRYAQEYTKYQRAQGVIVQKKEEAVKAKKQQLETTNSQKRTLLAEGKKQQAVLETQQRERQVVVDELNKKQKQLQSTLAEQQKKNRQLNDRIDLLIQAEIKKAEEKRRAEEARRKAEEEKRKREEAARAKSKSQGGKASSSGSKSSSKSSSKADSKKGAATSKNSSSPSTPTFNAPDNADRQLSSSFAANQGRLPVPITGSYIISAHFGPYTPAGLSGVTLDNKGTDFTGKSGAQARCIFDGEVTSVFSLAGLTNVLVRHGSYISVYCNLSSANVKVGQKVSTRQILGTVARDASGNATLHFQLRKETSKLNPERWIGR